MEIKIKYQIGQKVFFLDKGKAKCDVVKSMCVFVYEKSIRVLYGFQKTSESIYEDEVFPTETALRDFVFSSLNEGNERNEKCK